MHYWNCEKAVTADTERNHFEYFPRSGVLHVAKPMWTDDTGTKRNAKTVAVFIDAIRKCPEAAEIFKRVAESVDASASE